MILEQWTLVLDGTDPTIPHNLIICTPKKKNGLVSYISAICKLLARLAHLKVSALHLGPAPLYLVLLSTSINCAV